MTDITELAQQELAQLRAELSNQAIGNKDHLRKIALSLVDKLEKYRDREIRWLALSDEKSKIITDQEEALEKAQQERDEFRNRLKLERSILEDADKRIAELEDAEQKLCAANVTLDARAELAERQLAELESRTVTVKQFDEFQICHYGATEDYAKGYIDCQNNFFKWLNTAGIKWEAE